MTKVERTEGDSPKGTLELIFEMCREHSYLSGRHIKIFLYKMQGWSDNRTHTYAKYLRNLLYAGFATKWSKVVYHLDKKRIRELSFDEFQNIILSDWVEKETKNDITPNNGKK